MDIEVVIADVAHPRLTITPERVTFKWDGGPLWTDRQKVIDFIRFIHKRLHPVECSWRGTIHWNGKHLGCVMVNNKRVLKGFRDDEHVMG